MKTQAIKCFFGLHKYEWQVMDSVCVLGSGVVGYMKAACSCGHTRDELPGDSDLPYFMPKLYKIQG